MTFCIPLTNPNGIHNREEFFKYFPITQTNLHMLLKRWGESFIKCKNKELFLIEDLLSEMPFTVGSLFQYGMTLIIHEKNAWNLSERFLWTYKPKEMYHKISENIYDLFADINIKKILPKTIYINTYEDNLIVSMLPTFKNTTASWENGFSKEITNVVGPSFQLSYPWFVSKITYTPEKDVEVFRFQMGRYYIALSFPIQKRLSNREIFALLEHIEQVYALYIDVYEVFKLTHFIRDYLFHYNKIVGKIRNYFQTQPDNKFLAWYDNDIEKYILSIKRKLFTTIEISLKNIIITVLPKVHLYHYLDLLSFIRPTMSKPLSFYCARYILEE